MGALVSAAPDPVRDARRALMRLEIELEAREEDLREFEARLWTSSADREVARERCVVERVAVLRLRRAEIEARARLHRLLVSPSDAEEDAELRREAEAAYPPLEVLELPLPPTARPRTEGRTGASGRG